VGRGRKIGIVLLVLFVILVGLVVVADRVGVNVAENQIAVQADKEIHANGASAASKPKVTIGGFPFLTQVAAGKYERITIEADKPQSNGVQLEHLKLVATNVRAQAGDLMNGHGPVTAGLVTGTANISWQTVKSLIQVSGLPVPFDPAKLQITVVNNAVELRLPITVGGFSTTLRANGTVSIADGEVRLRLSDVGTTGTDLPPAGKALLNQYKDRLTATIRTPQMPYKLILKTVTTDASGVLVTATSDNIQLVGA
jgi:hypothetical protein